MVSIETEHDMLFFDHVKKFMKQIAGSRINNNSALNITKTLADPINFWHFASFFKWGSSSSLSSL